MTNPLPISLPALVAGTALAWCLGTASADAATYCVKKPSCVGTPAAGFQEALDLAAASTGTTDSIELGPETFTTSSGFYYHSGGNPANHVKISGTFDKTVLQTVDATTSDPSLKVLNLTGAGSDGSYVAKVSVLAPIAADAKSAATGLRLLDASAEDVYVGVRTGAGAHVRSGIELRAGSRLRFVEVVLPTQYGAAIDSLGSGIVAEDLLLSGGNRGIFAGSGAGRIARARIDARGGPISGIACVGCDYEVDDTMIRVDGSDAAIEAIPASASSEIDASHVTIVGAAPNSAKALRAATNGAGNAIVRADNCLLHGVATTLQRQADPAGGGFASVVTRNCNYGAGKEQESGPGFIDAAAHTSYAPDLVNQAGGNFRLLWSSPLIDAGRTNLFVESPWTLDAMARVVDGDGDGTAAPDLGAYEYQAGKPVALLKGPETAPAGAAVTFDGSASHGGDPGEPVTFKWTLPGGATATTPTVTFVPPPGEQTVSLVVTDPTGNVSADARKLTVAAPAPHPTPEPGPAPLDPPPAGIPGPVLEPGGTPQGGDTAPPAEPLASVRVVRRAQRLGAELTLGRPAAVRVRLQRRSDGRWRTRHTTARSLPAGLARVLLPRRLAKGRWRVVVRAVAGTTQATASARFRVR